MAHPFPVSRIQVVATKTIAEASADDENQLFLSRPEPLPADTARQLAKAQRLHKMPCPFLCLNKQFEGMQMAWITAHEPDNVCPAAEAGPFRALPPPTGQPE